MGHKADHPSAGVCFISPLGAGLYRPESGLPFGGAEAQFFLLSRALAEDPAVAVSVLTTVEGEPWTERHGNVAVLARRARGRRSVSVPRSRLEAWRRGIGYAAAFIEMYRLLRRINARVYLHAGAGVEVGSYALICRLLRRRFIYVVASSADLTDKFGLVTGPLKRLFPLGVRLADAVICRTQDQAAWLKETYDREGVLIRTGYPVPRDPQPEAETKRSILWVGRGHPLKQPHLLLSMAEQLPDEQFVMVLMPDAQHGELANELRARAARLPNVRLRENLPWESMDAVFQESKLFINTSIYEGFPNTFVQAAMHGTPILSWGVDPDRVLTDQGIGVCARASFGQMVELARRLCQNNERRLRMGRQAQEYARKHHDLSRSVVELKALVQQLAGGT